MKTGLHCNTTRDTEGIYRYYRESGANVIKVMTFDRPFLERMKAAGVTVIGRVYDGNQDFGDDAKQANAEVLKKAREMRGLVDLWEGFNEFAPFEGEIGRYAEIEIARMQLLGAHGFRCIIGNFSCGQPQRPWDPTNRGSWDKFRPAIEEAVAGGHALGLHEYSGPYMQYMVQTPDGLNQWDHAANRFKGASANGIWDPKLQGHLTLRYRSVYDRVFRQAWGMTRVPDLYITEGGVDNVNPRPGGQGAGYKAFANTEWARLPGIGDYAEQRRWYMWQVSHDTYVKGVVDFGYGTEDPTWGDFDMSTDTAMLDRVIAREADLPIGHFGAPAPTPTPQPAPSPAPVPTAGPFAAIEVGKGEGRDSVARRAYSLPPRPVATVKDAVRRIEGANPGKDWGPGARLRVPGLKVVKGD